MIPNAYFSMPLHEAAKHGNSKLCSLLINHAADVNGPPNKFSHTPLHLAVEKLRYETVELLLSLGANPDTQAKNRNSWARGFMPLHKACELNDELK